MKQFLVSLLFFFIPVVLSAQETKILNISKQELINAGKINIYFDNFDFDTDIEVLGYTATGYIRAGDISVKVRGTNRFSKDVVKLIRKTRKNEIIYFENIKVRLNDGTVRTLKPITVRVK